MRRTSILLLLLAQPALAQQATDAVQPEQATQGQSEAISDEVAASLAARAEGRPVEAQDWMVIASNPGDRLAWWQPDHRIRKVSVQALTSGLHAISMGERLLGGAVARASCWASKTTTGRRAA